jgi:hypothetical protein
MPHVAPTDPGGRAVPAVLFEAAGRCLGSRIAAYELMQGGFTGQANCALTLEDGRRAVMKTTLEGEMHPMSHIPRADILRRESWVYRNLENTAPYRPGYLGDVQADGWIGLIIEYVDADRVPPWTDEAIEGTARALAALHRLPRPDDLPPDIMRRTFPQPFFERIQARNRAPGRLPPAYTTKAWWDWLDSATPTISAALDGFFGPLPFAFCHNDVRSDNMLVRNGAPILLDWCQVVWSTPARDSVYWAVGVEREGGGRAPAIFERYLAAGGVHPTDAAVAGTLAWWFAHSIDCLQDDELRIAPLLLRIDQMPTVLRWLVDLLDLPRPPVALSG